MSGDLPLRLADGDDLGFLDLDDRLASVGLSCRPLAIGLVEAGDGFVDLARRHHLAQFAGGLRQLDALGDVLL